VVGKQVPLDRRLGGESRHDASTCARDCESRTGRIQKSAGMRAAVEALVLRSERTFLLRAGAVRINAPYALGRAHLEPWRLLSTETASRGRNRGSERIDQDRKGGDRDSVAPQAGEKTHRRMLLDPWAKRVASRRLPGLLHRSEHPTSDRLRNRPAGKFDQIEISRSRVSFGASRAAMRSVQFWPDLDFTERGCRRSSRVPCCRADLVRKSLAD